METRHTVERSFGSEFQAIIAELWRPKVARRWNFVRHFCAFLGKTTPYVKIFKILFRNFLARHRSMLLCSNFVKFGRREIGEIVRYLMDKKISPTSQTVAIARIALKICQGQPPTMYSACSSFHPNQFILSGDIAERVNTAKSPYKSNFRPKHSFEPNKDDDCYLLVHWQYGDVLLRNITIF